MAKRGQQKGQQGEVPQLLGSFNSGYNGYSNPTTLTPKQWLRASNVYSGQHGKLFRARMAPVVNINSLNYGTTTHGPVTGLIYTSLYNFRDSTPQELLLADANGRQWSLNISNGYSAIQRRNIVADPTDAGTVNMQGPWSRVSLQGICYEINGFTKQTGRNTNLSVIENLGIDAPDSSPAVQANQTGSITKTVGRSYQYAWENINKSHVSSPSPSTQYVAYSAQSGVLNAIEPGTLNANSGTTIVQGTNTLFTVAWIGKNLWYIDAATNKVQTVQILSIQTGSSMNVTAPISVAPNSQFTVIDPQVTHVRYYATADGGAIYFRINRQTLLAGVPFSSSGLQFSDNDNSEPPNGNFTQEVSQFYNVPPPIGTFQYEYQSRILTYGVAATPQSFYYSNIENTTIGNAPESCAPLNQIALPIGDGVINCMAGLPTGLLIWSDRHDMFKISGLLTDNSASSSIQLGASIQRLPYSLGAAGPYSSCVTPLGVIWLTSDREVYLFTDHYAPRNIGRAIQDILSAITPTELSSARITYMHADDRNWVALAITSLSNNLNNKLLILDLDMLASNGQPSFFVFDMATNQPTWYIYDVNCHSIASVFDPNGVQHILATDLDQIVDVTWRDGYYSVSGELNFNAYITLHALGNDTADTIKKMNWIRFITNRSADQLESDQWAFSVGAIDDDVYTFADPYTLMLYPGVNSPLQGAGAAQPVGITNFDQWPGSIDRKKLEFGPGVFRTKGIKALIGRRFLITVQFPAQAGADYALLNIQCMMQNIESR